MQPRPEFCRYYDAVEEAFDVDIHDPVIPPASLTRSPDRVDRGTPGSISIRVRMEHRFQQRLQVSANNLLADTVRNRRNPQRPRPSGRFRYVHPAHGRRHIAARRQPIPELVEVVAEAILEVLDRLSIHTSRSLIGLHSFEGLPDFPLRNVERLCPDHSAPPVTGWPPARTEHHNPFGPPPLQRLQTYYGLFCPCAPHRYSGPCEGCPLDPLPSHRSDRFPRSMQEPDPGSRRLRAGCRMSRASGLRSAYPGTTTIPGSDTIHTISAFHRRFASARLPGPHLTGSGPAFSATLTTIALYDSSSRWFGTRS